MSSTFWRARSLVVVGASTLAIGVVASLAPSSVTVSADAAVSTSVSTSTVTAGELTAQGLSPVIAASTTLTPAIARVAAASRTTTRPVVAPYAFGTKAYNKWWARYYMVTKHSWKTTAQYTCLVNLWTRESNWNHRAANSSSGAYGIPQALPGSKMRVYGTDWRNNPRTQIQWGLNYIGKRYGTPCRAWTIFKSRGWY